MGYSNASVSFVKVTKQSLISFLEKASERIVIAKAGYFIDEVKTLLYLVEQKKVRCDVYVDIDEKTIRYGFGDQAAFQLLNENLDKLNVQSANYIRMAIVIVDDAVMVYSPVALSWEEVPEQIDFPNGFIGGPSLAASLLRQIDGEVFDLNIEGINLSVQTCPVIQKEADEIEREISSTISKLKENPPVDPATLRKTMVYRNKYKLLKMSCHGVKIKNKSISLRPFNRMLSVTNHRLKSSWNVLTKEDVENLAAINEFAALIDASKKKYTFDANRFGSLIELKNIKTLEDCIAQQVEKLTQQLSGGEQVEKDHPKKQITSETDDNKKSGEADNKDLYGLLKESRSALVEHLLPQALKEKGCYSQLFKNDRSLYRRLQKGEVSEKDAVKQAIETFVDYKLNFPKAQEMIDHIHVEFDYFDISDELLAKKEFIEIVKKFELQIRDYQEGYEKGKQLELFKNYE